MAVKGEPVFLLSDSHVYDDRHPLEPEGHSILQSRGLVHCIVTIHVYPCEHMPTHASRDLEQE